MLPMWLLTPKGSGAVKKRSNRRDKKATMGSTVPVPQDISRVLTGRSATRPWVSKMRKGMKIFVCFNFEFVSWITSVCPRQP